MRPRVEIGMYATIYIEDKCHRKVASEKLGHVILYGRDDGVWRFLSANFASHAILAIPGISAGSTCRRLSRSIQLHWSGFTINHSQQKIHHLIIDAVAV